MPRAAPPRPVRAIAAPVTLLAIFAYLAIQLGIGVWVSRRIRTEEDYLVAGRRLGYTLATFSIFATWFGAETIVGSGGRALREGFSLTAAEPFGYGLCLVLMGLVFAVPFRSTDSNSSIARGSPVCPSQKNA